MLFPFPSGKGRCQIDKQNLVSSGKVEATFRSSFHLLLHNDSKVSMCHVILEEALISPLPTRLEELFPPVGGTFSEEIQS